MSEWKLVKTAPKDWTDVILYVPDDDDGFGACGVCQGWYSMEDGGFDCWMTVSGPVEPTHWQPLPAPPQGGAS